MDLAGLPVADRLEVCFAGRSNVGKSSLINALTGRAKLARASTEPGRTRELNYFDIGEGRLFLVDLPGFGYAQVSKTQVAAWTRLIRSYLRGRPSLRRVFLLVDSRRGLMDTDTEIMDLLDGAAVNYQIILTKVDKVPKPEVEKTAAALAAKLKKRGAAHPVVLQTSSEKGWGIAELRAENERLRRVVLDLEAENLQRRQKRSRPELLKGAVRRIETPLGTLYVTITEDDKGQPFEVFMSLGKAGGALMADVEALGRLISLALRSGIPMREIYRQLRGISSDRQIGLGQNKVLSVPDAVGIAIERWMQDKQGIQQELLPTASTRTSEPTPVAQVTRTGSQGEQMLFGTHEPTLAGACPDCGSQLEYAEGCMKCHVCGFSECG